MRLQLGLSNWRRSLVGSQTFEPSQFLLMPGNEPTSERLCVRKLRESLHIGVEGSRCNTSPVHKVNKRSLIGRTGRVRALTLINLGILVC